MTDDDRRAFEEDYQEAFGWKPRRVGDEYIDPPARNALKIWLAALAHSRKQVGELVEAVEDMLSGWRYIREVHGDLPGVGWDRSESAVRSALAAKLKEQHSLKPENKSPRPLEG